MLLTISTTRSPATDLGYLLHKHPERVQRFKLGAGSAHVFYPEASEERCTAALLLDIDPIDLVRRGPASLTQYVNDRPYVASSHMSVAIGKVFGSALKGRCEDRPELVDEELPLEATLTVLPCRGGEELLRTLFEPLGWSVDAERHPLPASDGQMSRYFTIALSGTQPLSRLLNHLVVLIPVLDDEKHYWVGDDEIEKLMRRGEGWLPDHPERELISRRYLKHRRALVTEAMTRLLEEAGDAEVDDDAPEPEEVIEEKVALNKQRLDTVATELKDAGCRSVVDLGCGEGRLLAVLRREKQFDRLLGVDVSPQVLDWAADRLRIDQTGDRIRLIHGSLLYRDSRLSGFDGAALVEVVEHVEPGRLADLEACVFAHARPGLVVATTPNAEYNVRYPALAAGDKRHSDHRFEWTRDEFQQWANRVAAAHGYVVEFKGIGSEAAEVGSPTQMARFRLAEAGDHDE